MINFVADALPLLIMVAAAIGGLLLTIVLIVIVVTCRKVAKAPLTNSHEVKTSPQPDRFSNSSNETKANTLSSLSGQDDLDGSDSLPEYHANFIASQPDLLATSGARQPRSEPVEPGWHGYGGSGYRHQYSNRGYTTETPSDYSYRDYSAAANYANPYRLAGGLHGNESYGVMASTAADSLYSSGRFNAVAQKLSVMGGLSAEDLNESSIGTHV